MSILWKIWNSQVFLLYLKKSGNSDEIILELGKLKEKNSLIILLSYCKTLQTK